MMPGNAVGETASVTADGTGWEGWNRRMMSFVSHINRQDWTETYGAQCSRGGHKSAALNDGD